MRNSQRQFAFVICLSLALLWPGLGRAENLKLRVTVTRADVYLMPDTGSTVISVIRLGEILESDKQVGEWFRVILPPDKEGSRLTGFVHASIVLVISEKPEEKPAEEIPEKKEKPVEKMPVEEKPVEVKPAPPPPEPIESPKPAQPVKPPPPPSTPQPPKKSLIGFSLKLYGGMSYLLAGDINDHLQAQTDYWSERGVEVEDEFNLLRRGIDLGGEFIINLTPHFGIGIGGGYIQASSKSTVNNTWFGYPYQDTANPEVTAIPLTLSMYLNLPLGKRFNFTLHAGLGYYLGTFSWNYGYDSEFDDFEENWEGMSNVLGYHGGLGLEINFSSRIALVVEGFGRYAKLKSLKGDYTFEENYFGYQGQDSISEATLWYYEWRSSLTENYYPTIEFNDEQPEETSSMKNVREGEVDLTGFSVRVGIKIRF